MAYQLHQEEQNFKSFDIHPGEQSKLFMRVGAYDDTDTLRCMAQSRLNGSQQLWVVNNEGSNAGYVSIEVPFIQLEPNGFVFQVQKRVAGSESDADWVVIGTGRIDSLRSVLTGVEPS